MTYRESLRERMKESLATEDVSKLLGLVEKMEDALDYGTASDRADVLTDVRAVLDECAAPHDIAAFL